MKPLRTFKVTPYLPAALESLRFLAYNLHFSWNVETRNLFHRMDPDLWDACAHNPIALLGQIRQERLDELAEDPGFLAQLERAHQQLHTYLQEDTWYRKHRSAQAVAGECYAYFSAEFGLADCLPIYSGGLGVLAGDHLKAASDLGLPLVGVGLLYQKGYFRQYLNPDGWQQERYPINEFFNMPLELQKDAEDKEIRIEVDYPNRKVFARIWKVNVGRVPLYLLDTNIEPNSQYDQDITDELYGGDQDLRIHQEIMLGVGGVRALRALGIQPTVYHMNEGHSAFLAVERIRLFMAEQGLSFEEAWQVAKSSQMFTTHTPVPAGIDLFPPDKIDYYLGSYYNQLGLTRERFLALGRENTGDFQSQFSMAVLAINMASFVNGVSKLHGAVSRKMFSRLWSGIPLEEVPITSITNGVHARTWVGDENQALYDRYLGPDWPEAPPSDPIWQKVERIPDSELWRTHERSRSRLVSFTRERLMAQLYKRAASTIEIQRASEALNPEVLTVGFARRFATYKRATLLFRDPERFKALVTHPHHPIQFIFAGKAHPRDTPGKELIRHIVQLSRQPEFRHHLVFIEDYDMHVTAMMVAGVDVWLNNPLRPREASGTSGMKAAMNGGQNLSILDGWWDEADYYQTGWPIGRGEEYEDRAYQDEVESNALYDLLEKEVAPTFYQHTSDGLPHQWIHRMKQTIRLNAPLFSTQRMVQEYAERAYIPLSGYYDRMRTDHFESARRFTRWHNHVQENWYGIQVLSVYVGDQAGPLSPAPSVSAEQASSAVMARAPLTVTAELRLGSLQPQDVILQAYQGPVDDTGHIQQGQATPMHYVEMAGDRAIVSGQISYAASGLQGLALRVIPFHPDMHDPYELRLMLWA
ncbi:MAG: alpha-glucan family phosphorylase [Thermostichus sp. BF3_bins_97]